MIKCKSCKLFAHKACYLPMNEGDTFLCDVCQEKREGVCKYCENKGGLMKRIGRNFGHPLCLLYHPGVLVTSFMELTFEEIDSLKHTKKLKCEICGKSTFSVIRCDTSGKCKRATHIYCALKTYRAA